MSSSEWESLIVTLIILLRFDEYLDEDPENKLLCIPLEDDQDDLGPLSGDQTKDGVVMDNLMVSQM